MQGQALQQLIDEGNETLLKEMCNEWPFSRPVSECQMVFSKADIWLAGILRQRLIEPKLHRLGNIFAYATTG